MHRFYSVQKRVVQFTWCAWRHPSKAMVIRKAELLASLDVHTSRSESAGADPLGADPAKRDPSQAQTALALLLHPKMNWVLRGGVLPDAPSPTDMSRAACRPRLTCRANWVLPRPPARRGLTQSPFFAYRRMNTQA